MKTDILFILGGVQISGAEKRMLLTAAGISEETKYTVTIMVRRQLFDALKNTRFSKIGLGRLKIKTDLNLYKNRAAERFGYAISRVLLPLSGAKVMHFTLFTVREVLIGLMCRLFGSRVYYEITSVDFPKKSKACKLLLKYRILSDGIICVSDSVYSACNRIKTGDVRILKRTLPYVDDVGAGLEISGKENVVLFAHRLINRKNPILGAKVFTQLGKDFPNWNFVICGGGDLENDVSDIAGKGPRNVSFLGHHSNLHELLGKAKVFVSIISPDNYPSQSVLEALSCSCALVLSDTGQSKAKFISRSAENGKLVSLSENSLYEGLASLLKSENLNLAMQESRRFFLSEYSKEKYIAESLGFYALKRITAS